MLNRMVSRVLHEPITVQGRLKRKDDSCDRTLVIFPALFSYGYTRVVPFVKTLKRE